MSESDWIKTGMVVVSGLFTVLWWLLKQKAEQHEKEMTKLWDKYDTLKESLQRHQVCIAEDHYKKPELDNKFGKLEKDIKDGFEGIGDKFDKMTKSLVDHI